MTIPDFAALEEQLNQLVQDNRTTEALELIINQGPNFPNDRIWVDFWKMYLAASLENNKFVFQVAEQSLADGLWYSTVMWQRLPGIMALQADPRFEQILAASMAAEAKDARQDNPVLLTRYPENHTMKSPLLVALHGNESSAELTLPFWQAATTKGWLLALPQSTQILYKGAAYSWDDFKIARSEVAAHISQLEKQIAFDPDCVVLAGHSMGGLVAIRLALSISLKIRGFVVIGPAVPYLDNPEELEVLLAPASQSGLRGYFIVGEEDKVIFADKVFALSEKLQSAGIMCEIETIPGAAHGYIPAYDNALLRGLAYTAPHSGSA